MAISVTKGQKKIEMNGAPCSRSIDLLGGLRSVIFHGEDIEIVSGPPSLRRRFLDIAACQASKNYAYNLRDYYRILRQRNSAISQYASENITEWDEQLSAAGAWLTRIRANVIAAISHTAGEYVRSVAGEKASLGIKYLPSGEEQVEKYKIRLSKAINFDMARGATSIGPHRDDFRIFLNGAEARHYASSGEKKTVALALKLAEVEFIRSVTGEKPALLLDDVFSMLDLKRSRALLDLTKDGSQCIITLTDTNSIWDDLKNGALMYEVKEGKIKQAS